MTYTLYGRPGWGSAIVEAQLVWYGLPFTVEPVGDLLRDPCRAPALETVNPLAQLPTLVMPDGTVMSESAAITLLLADVTGKDSLVPRPGATERGDVPALAGVHRRQHLSDLHLCRRCPARFVEVETPRAIPFVATRRRLRAAPVAPAREARPAQPWFLGERFSALDIYLDVMTRWGPKRPWFETETPEALRHRPAHRRAAGAQRDVGAQPGEHDLHRHRRRPRRRRDGPLLREDHGGLQGARRRARSRVQPRRRQHRPGLRARRQARPAGRLSRALHRPAGRGRRRGGGAARRHAAHRDRPDQAAHAAAADRHRRDDRGGAESPQIEARGAASARSSPCRAACGAS